VLGSTRDALQNSKLQYSSSGVTGFSASRLPPAGVVRKKEDGLESSGCCVQMRSSLRGLQKPTRHPPRPPDKRQCAGRFLPAGGCVQTSGSACHPSMTTVRAENWRCNGSLHRTEVPVVPPRRHEVVLERASAANLKNAPSRAAIIRPATSPCAAARSRRSAKACAKSRRSSASTASTKNSSAATSPWLPTPRVTPAKR
jgi:hypothetical protein